MKLTILWSSLASYSVAFFRELAISQGFTIQLVYQRRSAQASYEPFDLSFCEIASEDSPAVTRGLDRLVKSFAPDCILMCSWNFRDFMRIARRLRGPNSCVVAQMDNQWSGTLRQCLGILSSPFYLWPSIDTFLVAGDRQAAFARKLGYSDVLYGCYAAQVEHFFSQVPIANRPGPSSS